MGYCKQHHILRAELSDLRAENEWMKMVLRDVPHSLDCQQHDVNEETLRQLFPIGWQSTREAYIRGREEARVKCLGCRAIVALKEKVAHDKV